MRQGLSNDDFVIDIYKNILHERSILFDLKDTAICYSALTLSNTETCVARMIKRSCRGMQVKNVGLVARRLGLPATQLISMCSLFQQNLLPSIPSKIGPRGSKLTISQFLGLIPVNARMKLP